MTDIEIPYKQNRDWKYRVLEILPGALSWSMLVLPLVLSLINVTMASLFILAYLLTFFARSLGVNFRAFQGYKLMQTHRKLPWHEMLQELQKGKMSNPDAKRPQWHIKNLAKFQDKPLAIRPSDVIHV